MLFDIFKKRLLYLRIYSDKMEIRDLTEHKTISKNAIERYSNNRLLISEFNNAEKLLRNLIYDTIGKKRFLPKLLFLVQPMEKNEGGISEVEKRIFRDLCEMVGCLETRIYEGSEILNDKNAILKFKEI